MAFGSNIFPLGPNGQFPVRRISNSNHQIAPPNLVEQVYAGRRDVKLPVTEKDFHSSVSRPKAGMKSGVPHPNSMTRIGDMDKYRPRYAPPTSLRTFGQNVAFTRNNAWLKRRNQRFPGLETVGYEVAADARVLNPATKMSGLGFFGRNGNLGDVQQQFLEDEAQGRMNGVNYFRRPYR